MESEKTEVSPTRSRWRRAAVKTSIVVSLLLTGVAILPLAVMNSSHRDQILNSRLQKQGWTITSESGSGSWVTPLSIRGITLTDESGQVKCVIRELRSSLTVTGFLLHGGDLGTFTIVEPIIQVALDESGSLPADLFRKSEPEDIVEDGEDKSKKLKPEVVIDVQDAGLVVTVPERELPVIELEDLDVIVSLTNHNGGRWLDTTPVQIFDHHQISESDSEQNLALIAPVLSQSTGLSGEISARLNAISVQLDQKPAPMIPISGEAVFHSVRARMKQDWAKQISASLGQVTGQAVPDRLEIARESSVQWALQEDGVYHQGLAFLLPEIASDLHVQSSGTVGFDQGLNLALSVLLPQLPIRNPLTEVLARMTRFPLALEVKGTVQEPRLQTPPDQPIVDQLARNLNPNAPAEPPSVAESVLGIMNSAASPRPGSTEGIVGGVLDIIRAAKKAKENAPPRQPKPPKIRKQNKKKRKRQLEPI